MKDQEKIVDMCIAAYVQVMGAEVWNRLTAQQQHDAIMIMIKDMSRAMDKINICAE